MSSRVHAGGEGAYGRDCLTLFRKPLSTPAAFTDRDLGIRMGFSRITVGKKKDGNKRESEWIKRTIVRREENDSQSNLPVGDCVCCVGGRERAEMQRTLFYSLSHTFCGLLIALRLPQLTRTKCSKNSFSLKTQIQRWRTASQLLFKHAIHPFYYYFKPVCVNTHHLRSSFS